MGGGVASSDPGSIVLSGSGAHTINRRKEVIELATKKEIHELIGRTVADADFRASLVEDPEKALKEAGYDLTEEQLAALKQADLEGFSADLDERLSKEVGLGEVGIAPWPT
jgi:hypothetical protein